MSLRKGLRLCNTGMLLPVAAKGNQSLPSVQTFTPYRCIIRNLKGAAGNGHSGTVMNGNLKGAMGNGKQVMDRIKMILLNGKSPYKGNENGERDIKSRVRKYFDDTDEDDDDGIYAIITRLIAKYFKMYVVQGYKLLLITPISVTTGHILHKLSYSSGARVDKNSDSTIQVSFPFAGVESDQIKVRLSKKNVLFARGTNGIPPRTLRQKLWRVMQRKGALHEDPFRGFCYKLKLNRDVYFDAKHIKAYRTKEREVVVEFKNFKNDLRIDVADEKEVEGKEVTDGGY